MQCGGQTPGGVNANIIGPNNTAEGPGSVAIRANSHAFGLSSISIGGLISADSPWSMVIGTGKDPKMKLISGYPESRYTIPLFDIPLFVIPLFIIPYWLFLIYIPNLDKPEPNRI